jgi:hypothetical protein
MVAFPDRWAHLVRTKHVGTGIPPPGGGARRSWP